MRDNFGNFPPRTAEFALKTKTYRQNDQHASLHLQYSEGDALSLNPVTSLENTTPEVT